MFGLILIFLGLLAIAPFLLERRKPDMNDEIRARAPEQFAKLSDGHTHFQWHGPDNGPVLVCVHGLTTPSYVWDQLMPGLTEAGFRVLTYDLYGRGLSDRPKGAQTRSFFMRQLRDLLQHQGVEDGFALMGYSMGGSIATIFAAEEPNRVSHLILLAPAGMVHNPSKLSDFARRVPYIGDWLMLAFGRFEIPLAKETEWRGYLPAVLSSMRNILDETLGEEHRNIAANKTPVSAIWGELDTVIPLSAMGKLVEWNRTAQQATIPNADHALGITHPTEVLQAMATLMNNRP